MSENSNTDVSFIAESTSSQHFENRITGIYGTFDTPAGRVAYLQTKARLKQDNSIHSKLTKAIVPAREALNLNQMNFNQLLQRDLDDHRIATKLIEYVLNPPVNSLPGFFPPILAVLLPFDSAQIPLESFPKASELSVELDPEFKMRCACTTYGTSYRSQVLLQGTGEEIHELSLAILRWNPGEAKLVIMDGQHRAMALLAIHRTLTNTWDASPKGNRYKPFYEHHVRDWIAKAKADGRDVEAAISRVELPVTICWFPEPPKNGENPHRAARKLFVDVNNNAKPPSESRLTLLSDTRLTNVFSRELLNRLRSEESEWLSCFPLFAVEYDNPEKEATSPNRWSALTSLDILRDAVTKTVFGPNKVVEEAAPPSQGAPPTRDMDARMRKQLKVEDLFPLNFEDGERAMNCDSLGDYIFPIDDAVKHQKLLDAFYERFGKGILKLLSSVAPYQAHLAALQERYTSWTPADNNAILAHDALFEGVGMLWTIKEGHDYWMVRRKDARDRKQPEPAEPDISKAWKILDEQQKPQFFKRRCELYLGSSSETDLEDAKSLYGSLITYAAQIGLMLAWVSLHTKACVGDKSPADLSGPFAAAINATLNSARTDAQNKRRILLKESGLTGFKPLNELPRLQPQFSTYYRYLWLELALAEPGRNILKDAGVDLHKADAFLAQCRKCYLALLIAQRERHHMQDAALRALSDEAAKKKEARKNAEQDVIESQAQALKYWFGGSIEDARSKSKARVEDAPVMTPEDASVSAADEEVNGDTEETAGSEADTI